MRKYQIAIGIVCSVILLTVGNYFLKKEFQKKEAVKKEVFRKDLQKWEELKKVSPTYRDAYVQLAIGYQQLGLTSQAQENLTRVLELDPGWLVPPLLAPLLP